MHDPSEFNRKFAAAFAVLIVLLIFAYIAGVTFLSVPGPNMDLAKQVVIFLLGSGFGTVVGFFYGAAKQKEPPNSTFPQPNDVSVK